MSKEEQIRTAIDNLDEQTAKDALALLLAGNTAGLKRPEFTSSTETDASKDEVIDVILLLLVCK